MAELFDNPKFSDVVFEFPSDDGTPCRVLYANKGLLVRSCDYFESLFEGGFAEDYRVPMSSYIQHCRETSRLAGRVRKCPRPLDLRRPTDPMEQDDSDAELDVDECLEESTHRAGALSPAIAYPVSH